MIMVTATVKAIIMVKAIKINNINQDYYIIRTVILTSKKDDYNTF